MEECTKESSSRTSVAKRMWRILRVAFFLIRKGSIASKQKLMVDMNLMLKQGKVMGKKTLASVLLFYQNHRRNSNTNKLNYRLGMLEYEFSCTQTPNPAYLHAKQRRWSYFTCIKVVESTPHGSPVPAVKDLHVIDSSLFSRRDRLSSYWLEEESEYDDDRVGSEEVDSAAEEFIRRFYEQLRAQSYMALLECQEHRVAEEDLSNAAEDF